MKKTTASRIILASLLLAFQLAFSQGAPEKIAVYVSGASEAGVNKSLGNRLIATIAQNSGYAEIGDMEAFYKELSGKPSVSISQTVQAAKQHGADIVCAVSLTEVFGAYSISARMIKTADSQVIKTASLEHSLKSFEDLASVSNRLAAQFTGVQPIQQEAAYPLAAAPAPAPIPAPVPAANQCSKMHNINELAFKIQESFPKQLKDCSAKLAKDMAFAASPFGKKSAAPEPKSFMTQCAVGGIKESLPADFPGVDKAMEDIQNFTQNILNSAYAGNALDPKKLIKAVDDMRIDELLGNIKNLAASYACISAEPYEPLAPVAANAPPAERKDDEASEREPKVHGGTIAVLAAFFTAIIIIATVSSI